MYSKAFSSRFRDTQRVRGQHTLLGLVAEAAGLVRARRVGRAVDGRQLAVLPCANAQQEPQHVGLLPLVELLKVLVGAHGSAQGKYRL